MRLVRVFAGVVSLALVFASSTRADTPPDPLRLIPDQADLFLKIEQPRKLIESVTGLDVIKQLYQLDIVREYYDSTNYRRFQQLVAYFEKQLGVPWLEIVDRVAGGGAVVAAKFGPNPAPALVAIQGREEKFVQKFAQLALELLDQELARQESKERVQKRKHRDVEIAHVGDGLYAAVIGSAILLSNNAKALEAGIDLHRDGNKKSLAGVSRVGDARKLLPGDPLAWAWINLETVKKLPPAKEIFTLPRNDVNVTVLLGRFLDLVGRSPFACAGVYRTEDGYSASLRIPAGREGRTADLAPYVPAMAGQPAGLPLLEPKGVLLSSSYYFDLSQYWEQRHKLFNKEQVQTFEEFDKTSGRFLGGVKFSKLVAQAGPHQRIVVTQPSASGYKITPTTRIPAFAFVVDMREKQFAKSMEAVLRAAALIATTQLKLKMVEEKHGDVMLVGYRFPEDARLPGGDPNYLFNFSPCFAAVGDQYLMASTLELGHELVDLLKKETSQQTKKEASGTTERTRVYSAGGAAFLQLVEDQLFVQFLLGQALPPAEARQQVKALIDVVRRLGVFELESQYGARDFRYDVRVRLGK